MKSNNFHRIWGMPLLLAALTLFGLLSALLGNGIWYLLSWIALCIPVVVILWYALQRTPKVLTSRQKQ